jgi:hypothetical protein
VSEFDSTADFYDAKFGLKAIFDSVQFKGDVFFNLSTLPKYLDFSQVTEIAREIGLTKSVIDTIHNICNINLIYASINKFRFRYNRFKLWFAWLIWRIILLLFDLLLNPVIFKP